MKTHRRTTRSLTTRWLIAGITLLAASCGGGSSPTAPTVPAPTPSATPVAGFYEEPPAYGADLIFSNVEGQTAARPLRLPSPLSVGQLRWWGIYEADPPAGFGSPRFLVSFYADRGGAPEGQPLYSANAAATVTDTGRSIPAGVYFSGRPIWQFDMTLAASVGLAAGQDYWISIAEADARTSPGPREWLWSGSATDGPVATRVSGGWTVSPNRLPAFRLAIGPASPAATVARRDRR